MQVEQSARHSPLRDSRNQKKLHLKVKSESFRPFAPSVLRESRPVPEDCLH